ncbi:MAG: hypothetical protein E7505_03350 [Ruminococcus sp.]|nr:hypothetical protein [Ruminococcus sp.]
MARKKQEEESGGSWMDTYGDMVTLLLTFFVMLYSMSTIVDEKWTALVSAFKLDGKNKVDVIVFEESDKEGVKGGDGMFVGAFEDEDPHDGTAYNSALDELFDKIKTYVEEHDMTNSILVNKSEEATPDGSTEESDTEDAKNIFISFNDSIFFEPDRSDIKPESNEILDFFGECLTSVQDDVYLIMIKGHTAKAPSSVVDSRLLSAERAGNISNFFEHKSGISSDLLLPMGWGSNNPIADNDTEEGRARNRRVEIAIINKNSELARNSDFLKAMGVSFDTTSKKGTDFSE